MSFVFKEAEMKKVYIARDERENVLLAVNDLIKDIKNDGYHIYGLFRSDDSKDIFDIKFNEKSLFMFGGEKRGLSSKLLEMCDDYLYISYGSDFRNSLNACAAIDVVTTLLYSQRRKW